MKSSILKNNIISGWKIKQIKDICKNFDSKRTPITKEQREKGKIPYYGATGIIDFVSEYIFNEELLLVGEDGADWSKYAYTSFIINGKSWVNNHAHVLKCVDVNPVFLKEYLNYSDLNVYISGGTRGKLTKGILDKIPILLPSLEEQKKIAEILSMVDEEINKTDELILKTEKFKNGLMNDLFSKGVRHKKFKKTKLGEIPKEWEVKKLEDVVFFENGKAHENFIDDNGKFIVINSKFISQEGNVIKRTNKGLKILNKEDIAIVMSDIPQGKALAKCFFVDEENKYTLNQRIGLLRPFDACSKYFFYVLNRNKYFLNFSNNTSQTNLRKQQVLDCLVPVPPINEQQKISEILSSIDKKLDKQKELKGELIQIKKGLMSDLLSGKVRV